MRLTKEQIKSIIPVLTKLGRKNSKPLEPYVGICSNVITETGIRDWYYSEEYKNLVHAYPEWSGNINYPVKHPTKGPMAGYAGTTDTLWSGPYGDNRRKFARYLACEFRKLLKKNLTKTKS